MSQILTFSPSPSFIGFGAVTKLKTTLECRGLKRILILTDPPVAESGILEKILDSIGGFNEVEVFKEIPAEPESGEIERQKGQFTSRFDALLALGGGSVMDFAKALSILMTHGGSMRDYLGEGSVPGPVIPVVCVPTTSGTGSQSTQTTVFSIDGVKRGASSEFVRPTAAVVDPELTVNLPPTVTRNSGYDALMHACESYFARPSPLVAERPILYQGSNPFSRALALEAFRSIWRSYRRAVADGHDRDARLGMSLGSHLAGIAFSHSGLGLIHALASSLGGMVGAPHGECLAASTYIGLRYNFETCERGLAWLAGEMALIDGEEVTYDDPEKFLLNIVKLIDDLGMPSRPSHLGLKRGDASTILANTLIQTRRIQTNPRALEDELLSLIEENI